MYGEDDEIAVVSEWVSPRSDAAEGIANASLIAAAPALLEALRQAVAEEGANYHVALCAFYDGLACDCWSTAARAALRAAEGA
mgnify:FL=1